MSWPLQVIPAIDLQAGRVVRGIGGQRSEYQSMQSMLVADPRPESVARAFVDRGLDTLYVADLDAIAGAEPAWAIYDSLLKCGARLWIDAGIATLARGQQLAQFHRAAELPAVIAGLESLPNWGLLGELAALIGPERLMFSLDLRAGQPLTSLSTRSRGPAGADGIPGEEITAEKVPAEDIAAQAIACGVRQMIVLDLASVGSAAGPRSVPLCSALQRRWPELRLISGGGVRSLEDLQQLAACGCQAALVASALHDGALPL